MNKENLLKMAEFVATIPQESFKMSQFRAYNDHESISCNSIGCVIGHCVSLAPELIKRDVFGSIKFVDWSENFTGIAPDSNDWRYLFSGFWKMGDSTPRGASKRIKHYVENGLPKNWLAQMYGSEPLSY